jgi:hypothetical protein
MTPWLRPAGCPTLFPPPPTPHPPPPTPHTPHTPPPPPRRLLLPRGRGGRPKDDRGGGEARRAPHVALAAAGAGRLCTVQIHRGHGRQQHARDRGGCPVGGWGVGRGGGCCGVGMDGSKMRAITVHAGGWGMRLGRGGVAQGGRCWRLLLAAAAAAVLERRARSATAQQSGSIPALTLPPCPDPACARTADGGGLLGGQRQQGRAAAGRGAAG